MASKPRTQDQDAVLAAFRKSIDIIDAALIHMLAERFRITTPLSDLLFADPYKALTEHVRSGALPARTTVFVSNGFHATPIRGCGRNAARFSVKSELPTWGRHTFDAGSAAHCSTPLASGT